MRARAGAVAAGLLVVASCSGGGGGDDDSADENEPQDTERPSVGELPLPDMPPFAEAADGGVVQVVERGFSVFIDSEGQPAVSWGVVLENTSDQVATYTDVRVELVDAAGASVPHGSGGGVRRVDTIAVLLPGQRFGIGKSDLLHGSGVADVRVEIGGSLWFPEDTVGVEFAEVTASEEVLTVDPAGLDDLTFAVDSSYSTGPLAVATAVFRNAAGQIVGGTSREYDSGVNVVTQGRGNGRITLLYEVPESDPANVEVFVDVRSVVTTDAMSAPDDELDDRSGEVAGVDGFCAYFEEYWRRNNAGFALGQDPRFPLAPLAAVEPPQEIATEWASFRDWRWGASTLFSLALELHLQMPSEVQDHTTAVTEFWVRECAGERGFEALPAVVDSGDEPDELPPFTEPDGGEIRLVEQGFTPTADSSGSPQVTYGAVVENTTDQVATNVRVTVTPAGAVGVNAGSNEFVVPILLPGQKYGLGATVYGDGAAMTGLDVAVDATEWWPADHELYEFAEMTTSEVTINRSSHGPYAVSFTIDSGYPVVLRQMPFHVIFRNAAGQIVGGANDTLSADVTPGRSFGEVYSNYPVPDVTDTATEVYV